MAGVAACLILSGYLLYYIGSDKVRSVVSILHWGIGLLVPFFFIWHKVRFREANHRETESSIKRRNYSSDKHGIDKFPAEGLRTRKRVLHSGGKS